MDLDVAQAIANELNVPLADVLGITAPSGATGFAQDVTPYVADGPGRTLPPLGANEYRFLVETNACENAGVKRGDVVVVNDSAAAVAAVQPLDVVIVLYHHPQTPDNAVHLLRQFVPPGLLITNAGADNARSIDVAREDAHIVSVITSVHRRVRNGAT